MRLLYPSDPLDPRRPDETWADEHDAARDAGLPCSLFSSEELEIGRFRPRPVLDDGEAVLQRGWMMTVDSYGRWCTAVERAGGRPLVSVE
ncbi:MAG TPA: hypothetical protein VKU40_06705, partial [Thermoanaerobaculia bacterium]|nr:hypothetical protein [Thermoanaerobaculia bacterium]